MTECMYLTDSYKKSLSARVISVAKHGDITEIVLDKTIFYPQGGGQPSDKGQITGKNGTLSVTHVRLQQGTVIHEGKLNGVISPEEIVETTINWNLRYRHMQVHSAGHILHEAVMHHVPSLKPLKGEHGDQSFIEYSGSISEEMQKPIEHTANQIISRKLVISTRFVSLQELAQLVSHVPEYLPKHKPLRIVNIAGYTPIPDGGTQVKTTDEVGQIHVTAIVHNQDTVKVYYSVPVITPKQTDEQQLLSPSALTSLILEIQQTALTTIHQSEDPPNEVRLKMLGSKSEFANLTRQLRFVPQEQRQRIGTLINEVKSSVEVALQEYERKHAISTEQDTFDTSVPGILPPQGHLHIVSQAITEITKIFERIGFTRVRHPEVDWDWYPFESLNMPPDHPARDEWETFFVDSKPKNEKFSKMVLTPHTSNGQVREMLKKNLPIRMINIAKCYRRQSDISHVPMFHQFEGLYVDKNVSIGHLKGVLDYFVKQFFGPERKARIRPFHFQFTEPSFEVDISCDVCNGNGCRLCKEGWLELGGAGMVHPVVLANGNVDTQIYNGFAFGWGVERTYMMKSGTKLDDIRLLYSNDIRFLEQF